MTSTGEFTDAQAAALLDAVGPAFSRLRRSVLLEVENPVSAKDMSRAQVLGIVENAEREGGPEITVGAVADHLQVDPSVASRMVSECIATGYLARAASQLDGRRTVVHLTEAGTDMLARFRGSQREAYTYITKDWPRGEQLEFARLLLKYVDSIGALREH